jgi:LAO/AO transport system ATPase
MLDELLERFGRRDRRALSRLLSRAARGEADPLLDRLPSAARPARVVAVTGSAGVGKSTLVGRLIEHLRRQGQSVAVLACDPESPLSGGALLGDRFRMPTQPDDGVFIRSLAAAPGEGAIARHLGAMVRLLETFGFDVVLIETAGAGQADTAVRELADVVLLLLQPETGDDLQWEKAGVLEVADVIAIQKADLPGADQLEAQVRSMLGLSPQAAAVPVLRVSAKTGAGIGELWQALAAAPSRRPAASHGRQLLQLAQERLQHWFATSRAQDDPRLKELLHRWQQGQIPLREAAGALLRLAGNGLSEP